ncbi:hypothetical protein ABBQ32_013084 [Trebouxia sp. C0010 RCD-2024]
MRLAQVLRAQKQDDLPVAQLTVAAPANAGWYHYLQTTLSSSVNQLRVACGWVFRLAKPELYFMKDSLMAELLKLCPVLHQPYGPPLVSLNGGMHMVLSVVVRRAYVTPKYTRHTILTPDGGTISLDWWHASHQSKLRASTPVLLCLHAFAGDSNESYMLFMCKEAKKMGWRSVAMNYRGCGNTPLTSPKPMHIGLSADVYQAVRYIRQQFPNAPVFLVGFSIGAYTMTKYVGEADSGVWSEDGRVQGAVLIGSGYDYAAEIAKISRPAILRLLNFHYINCSWWRGYCNKHKQQLRKDPNIDLGAVRHASWTSDAEAALICPAWGYPDIKAYYDDINGLNWIPKIRTPTLFLSAMDDPFLGESSPPRPYKACSSNPFTVFVLTAHGGHCAHLPLGSWLTGKAWMDTVAMQFFSAVLAYSGESSSSPVSAFADDIEKAGEGIKDGHAQCNTSAV